MKHIVFLALLVPSFCFAIAQTCPDLSSADHVNPLQDGWAIAVLSESQDVIGAKAFTNVKIGNMRVAGSNWVMCQYDNGRLSLIRHGKFNHPPLSELWYRTHYYDQCDREIETCYFESHH